jgi:hypothetical protein
MDQDTSPASKLSLRRCSVPQRSDCFVRGTGITASVANRTVEALRHRGWNLLFSRLGRWSVAQRLSVGGVFGLNGTKKPAFEAGLLRSECRLRQG